jgi:hypothetical protein
VHIVFALTTGTLLNKSKTENLVEVKNRRYEEIPPFLKEVRPPFEKADLYPLNSRKKGAEM